MRIGILTLPLHMNYGGILQAYALQTTLEKMGHQVVVFDRPISKRHLPLWKKPCSYAKRFIKKYLLGKNDVHVFQEAYGFNLDKIRRQYTQQFIDKRIHRYEINSPLDIKEDDFDGMVVGSDQIWRMMYFRPFWYDRNGADAFLAFTKNWNIKRVSYAASFGKDSAELNALEIKEAKDIVSRFDGVSVREQSGIDICKSLFGVDAKLVLDPTLLLKREDYLKLIDTNKKEKGILLKYILDENSVETKLVNKIAADKNLHIVDTNVAGDMTLRVEKRIQAPVEDWLNTFENADYVVTDSFHACVFSLLFHKPFTVIGNRTRGTARIDSLLNLTGLQDRLILSVDEYKEPGSIDFDRVDLQLEGKRKDSIRFLMDSLGYN